MPNITKLLNLAYSKLIVTKKSVALAYINSSLPVCLKCRTQSLSKCIVHLANDMETRFLLLHYLPATCWRAWPTSLPLFVSIVLFADKMDRTSFSGPGHPTYNKKAFHQRWIDLPSHVMFTQVTMNCKDTRTNVISAHNDLVT